MKVNNLLKFALILLLVFSITGTASATSTLYVNIPEDIDLDNDLEINAWKTNCDSGCLADCSYHTGGMTIVDEICQCSGYQGASGECYYDLVDARPAQRQKLIIQNCEYSSVDESTGGGGGSGSGLTKVECNTYDLETDAPDGCTDGFDNDNDGRIDGNDAECVECLPGDPTGVCDDNKECTLDECMSGTCSNMVQTGECAYGGPCQIGTCDNGMCVSAGLKECTDNNPCNGVETCEGATGNCLAGTALNCDDADACTYDACQDNFGCTHIGAPGLPGCDQLNLLPNPSFEDINNDVVAFWDDGSVSYDVVRVNAEAADGQYVLQARPTTQGRNRAGIAPGDIWNPELSAATKYCTLSAQIKSSDQLATYLFAIGFNKNDAGAAITSLGDERYPSECDVTGANPTTGVCAHGSYYAFIAEGLSTDWSLASWNFEMPAEAARIRYMFILTAPPTDGNPDPNNPTNEQDMARLVNVDFDALELVCADKAPSTACGDGEVDTELYGEICDPGHTYRKNSKDIVGTKVCTTGTCEAKCIDTDGGGDDQEEAIGEVFGWADDDEDGVPDAVNYWKDECEGTTRIREGSCDGVYVVQDVNSCPSGSICSAGACVEPDCGNGDLDPGEECDDNNVLDDDGCDSECMLEPAECGNGVLEQGEECEAVDVGPPGTDPTLNYDCNADCTSNIKLDLFDNLVERTFDGKTHLRHYYAPGKTNFGIPLKAGMNGDLYLTDYLLSEAVPFIRYVDEEVRDIETGDTFKLNLRSKDGTNHGYALLKCINDDWYGYTQWELVENTTNDHFDVLYYSGSTPQYKFKFRIHLPGEYSLSYEYLTLAGGRAIDSADFTIPNQPPTIDVFNLLDENTQPMSSFQDQAYVVFDIEATDTEGESLRYFIDSGKRADAVGVYSETVIGQIFTDQKCIYDNIIDAQGNIIVPGDRCEGDDIIRYGETYDCACKSIYGVDYDPVLPDAYFVYLGRVREVDSAALAANDPIYDEYLYTDLPEVRESDVFNIKLYVLDPHSSTSATRTLTVGTTAGRQEPVLAINYDGFTYAMGPDNEADIRINKPLVFDASETQYWACEGESCLLLKDVGSSAKLDYYWYINVHNNEWGQVNDDADACVSTDGAQRCTFVSGTVRSEEGSEYPGTPCTCIGRSDFFFDDEIYQGIEGTGRIFNVASLASEDACSQPGEQSPCTVRVRAVDPATGRSSTTSISLNIWGAENMPPEIGSNVLESYTTDSAINVKIWTDDEDGDEVTVELADGYTLPDGATFTLEDDGQGLLYIFNWPNPVKGIHELKLEASDGVNEVDEIIEVSVGVTLNAKFTVLTTSGSAVNEVTTVVVKERYTLQANPTSDEPITEYVWETGKLGDPWGTIDVVDSDSGPYQEHICVGEDITCKLIQNWQYDNKLLDEPCTCVQNTRYDKKWNIYPDSFFNTSDSSPVYTWSSPADCTLVGDQRICTVRLTVFTANGKASAQKTLNLKYEPVRNDLNDDGVINARDLAIFRLVLVGSDPEDLFADKQTMERDSVTGLSINDYVYYVREVGTDE